MRIFIKATIAGCALTGSLICIAIIPRAETESGKVAIFLLSPGILAGFAVGSGRVHDLGFWVLTALLNAVFYSMLALGVLWLGRIVRNRRTRRSR
jgi:hypothetical protein